jgi:hypothetical protein
MTNDSDAPHSPPAEDAVNLLHRALSGLAITPVFLLAASCGNDETAPPADDHTPVSYTVLVDDIPMTAPYTFIEGQTVRVRLRFLNAASEDLDDIESTHFAGLTFNPASLATVARITDHHYQFDVTGAAEGSGTMQVGFGHNEQANETTFSPADAVVDPAGGPGSP